MYHYGIGKPKKTKLKHGKKRVYSFCGKLYIKDFRKGYNALNGFKELKNEGNENG